MHFSKLAVVAAAVGSATAAAPSICDKYTTALLKENTGANQLTLLTLLVNTAVIGNFTGKGTKNPTLPGSMVDVPGILASPANLNGMPVNLLQYFDGSLVSTNVNGMPKSVNWLDGGSAPYIIANPTKGGMAGSMQETLLNHLYSYFGLLLQCSMVGKSGFPAYAGSASMFSVHQYMDLSATEFDYFVTQVGLAAASFGVSMSDITAAATALNSTFGMKNSPAAKVDPAQPAELQAICVASGCPTASNAVATAYPALSMAASVSSSASMSMSSSAAMSSSSGNVGEKTDGQPTVTAISTAGAALRTAMPAAAAGIAGLVALAL